MTAIATSVTILSMSYMQVYLLAGLQGGIIFLFMIYIYIRFSMLSGSKVCSSYVVCIKKKLYTCSSYVQYVHYF